MIYENGKTGIRQSQDNMRT